MSPASVRPAAGDDAALLDLARRGDPEALLAAARAVRDAAFGRRVTYSRKVFVPLTRLCRDVCHYCTFAQAPRRLPRPYLLPDEVLDIARAGAAAGCKEALFTLGDRPEARYRVAREALAGLGHDTTVSYLEAMAERVHRETGLLPHLNAGVLSTQELARLRRVSVSQGLMLESVSERLCERGGPHFGSPDKDPAVRLACLEAAGRLSIPFTSGILIGIGETREERVESLLALRAVHERHGHLQEVIVQSFRAKPGTPMAGEAEPDLAELQWTIALARLLLPASVSVQAPPNLSPGAGRAIVAAGIDDWGGISPVTPDFVNPEAPWPALTALARETAAAGKVLVERLAIYPRYAVEAARWVGGSLVRAVGDRIDADGLARTDDWLSGSGEAPPPALGRALLEGRAGAPEVDTIVDRALAGETLAETEVVRLFAARGGEVGAVCAAADALRAATRGETVSYVVNRNINYTNVCTYRCTFCAFSKGPVADGRRERGYDLDLDEIARRAEEAWARGATEVCMQGGIHPRFTGETYLAICRAVKAAVPGMHVHAFSPLEVHHGASSLGVSIPAFLERLREAGLGTLPGTAAEILDDEVRAIICPDKLRTQEWLEVVEAAHRVGLPTTSTIMFGHVERPLHWARHLLRLRALQARTGGLTELVPLPYVALEAPMYRRGVGRRGPTLRECLLMHAVARLVLHPLVANVQASWVKLGAQGAALALRAGANDLGGTLMDESITRAAGGRNGQCLEAPALAAIAAAAGRPARQRGTRYEPAGVGESSPQGSPGAGPWLAPRTTGPVAHIG